MILERQLELVGSAARDRSSGIMILAIRMPPGADMKAAASRIGQILRAEQARISGEDRAGDAGHADHHQVKSCGGVSAAR
jgi:hypothetical protein